MTAVRELGDVDVWLSGSVESLPTNDLAVRPPTAAATLQLRASETSSGIPEVWRRLGPTLASLICLPSADFAVRSAAARLITDNPLREVSSPLADLVIRCVNADEAAVVCAASEDVGCSATSSWLERSASDLPALAPSSPSRSLNWLRAHVEAVNWRDRFPTPVVAADLMAVRAGLWQVLDYLDESHSCSQAIEGEGTALNGDYWHAIMHRREPDFGNSKYWFRRVGQHPVFEALAPIAARHLSQCPESEATSWLRRLGGGAKWDPLAFVDFCQSVHRQPQSPLGIVARQIQWAEMLLLLEFSVTTLH